MKPAWWPDSVPYPQPSVLSPYYASHGVVGRQKWLEDQKIIGRAKKIGKWTATTNKPSPVVPTPTPTAPSGSAPQYVPNVAPTLAPSPAPSGSWAAGAFAPSPSSGGVVADASVAGGGDGASATTPNSKLLIVGALIVGFLLSRRS